MATAHLKGDSNISYVAPGESATAHLLAVPLMELELVDRGERHDWWAGNLTDREIVTVADVVDELYATIRLDNEPAALKRMLRLALRHNLTLTISQGGNTYPVKLVAVVGASTQDHTPIQRDRDREGYGEWECRILIRRVDGGSLTGIYSSESL